MVVEISRKRRYIWKIKLMTLKLTVRPRIAGTYVRASFSLRRVASLKLI
jgi:hypothetical protein